MSNQIFPDENILESNFNKSNINENIAKNEYVKSRNKDSIFKKSSRLIFY